MHLRTILTSVVFLPFLCFNLWELLYFFSLFFMNPLYLTSTQISVKNIGRSSGILNVVLV